MKPIVNTKIKKKIPKEDDSIVCKFCLAENSIRAHYSGVIYGTAVVINADGELDDYDSTDGDGYDVNEYECWECGETKTHLDDLIMSERELEDREDSLDEEEE